MADLFASAKRSLSRGQYHIGDLAARLNAIINEQATFVVEPHPDGIHDVQKLRFHPLFRDEFPCIVFDAVSNFRACLDQMTYAIAVRGGLDPTKYAPFPICKDVEFIDNQINGLKYLPPAIRTLFRSFNPYKGGNNTLWALSELCNIKKHAALVPINLPGYGLSFVGDVSGPASIGIMAPFDAEKNEIEIMRFAKGTQPKGKTEVTFAVVLKHPEEVINGQHPIFLLQAMRAMVERVLMATEAECRRIGLIT